MKIETYLYEGYKPSETRLERFADGCNFLARHALLGKRVTFNSDTNQMEEKTNAFFAYHKQLWSVDPDFYVGPLLSVGLAVVHVAAIPLALIGLAIGLPLKKFCLDKNEKSKAYHVATEIFHEKGRVEKKIHKNNERVSFWVDVGNSESLRSEQKKVERQVRSLERELEPAFVDGRLAPNQRTFYLRGLERYKEQSQALLDDYSIQEQMEYIADRIRTLHNIIASDYQELNVKNNLGFNLPVNRGRIDDELQFLTDKQHQLNATLNQGRERIREANEKARAAFLRFQQTM